MQGAAKEDKCHEQLLLIDVAEEEDFIPDNFLHW
jgi:hypothetical protein